MAEPLDVAARLAEGRPSVDNIGDYVWACHLLGYQNPDLTLHAAQVRDWYNSEDGLDLRALDADRAALHAAAAATQEAHALQEQQLGALAMRGRVAAAKRHTISFSATAKRRLRPSAVRTLSTPLAAFRDDLWRTVDGKVAAAVAVETPRRACPTGWPRRIR